MLIPLQVQFQAVTYSTTAIPYEASECKTRITLVRVRASTSEK